RADMYAYGYGWDGMIPLSKEGALALWDKGHEIFRLYENDAEGAVDNRADIENFDGLFGVEDPAWEREKREESFEAFIINRERYSKGEAVGEWLALPADADTLRNLLERIGVGEPSEEAFTVTAVRVPMPDYLRDHVTKYGSLDEMNMLAAYLRGMADFEFGKFQAILAYNGHMVGNGTAALINLLDEDNLAAFNMIPAEDAETLGRYYAEENDEKPDDVSFEQYGRMCQQEEGGVFTEWGYLYPRYGELLPMYTGTVPNEYRITDEALCGLRSHTPERGVPDEKPSVLGQIREARNTPPTLHRQRDGHNIGEPDL
ncbi:MAG: antirestriction protein ArdA, partial [Clostridiales bacterium]|nr:antirestriction protein ArdA [Clostridiales bacterium]